MSSRKRWNSELQLLLSSFPSNTLMLQHAEGKEFCLIWKSGLFFLPISQLHNTGFVYFATQGTCNRLVGSFKNNVPEHFDAVLLLPDWLVHRRCKHLWLMWLSVPARTHVCVSEGVLTFRLLICGARQMWWRLQRCPSVRWHAQPAGQRLRLPHTHTRQTSVNILACPASSQNQCLSSAKRLSHGRIIRTGYHNGSTVAAICPSGQLGNAAKNQKAFSP